ncbi:hypothetical protein [Helicobacter gastrocanis]|uniref:hypothetical protein n=1 Tax=Helicobacter gastrocanis TaxID=2849641 RepID=UPI001C85B596|nr:hypothetical protein [Helicobacter sp. NHP19-003]
MPNNTNCQVAKDFNTKNFAHVHGLKDFKEAVDFIHYFTKCARVPLCLSTAGLTLGKFC